MTSQARPAYSHDASLNYLQVAAITRIEASFGIDASFLEVDLGHEALSVWKEKTRHYLQFALSGEYQKQFGQDRFRVIVLANSLRRLNSIRATVAAITQKIFWFSTLDAVRDDRFFASVWLRPADETQQPFFDLSL